MQFIGVTGGIGAGKSTVAGHLGTLGATVIDADQIARDVVAPGTSALEQIVARFGTEIVQDGHLDRESLAKVVFNDPSALRDLEAITHPAIGERTGAQIAAAISEGTEVLVHDLALLIESGMQDRYDVVVVVLCDRETRFERLLVNRGMSREDAAARMASQVSDEERRAAADVVIDNSGDLQDTIAQVEAFWSTHVEA